MNRYLAVACLWPALLTAQEPAQDGGAATFQKWHEEQVAIGNANVVTRAKRIEQTENALLELERRAKLVLSYIEAISVERRKRVDIDSKWSAYVDSVRRTAEPIAVLTVLELRRDCVDRFAEEARALEYTWKKRLKRWERELDRSKGNVKFEHLVNLARGIVEFEGKRAAELRAESEALARQIERGKP
jgi:hypothetical protein